MGVLEVLVLSSTGVGTSRILWKRGPPEEEQEGAAEVYTHRLGRLTTLWRQGISGQEEATRLLALRLLAGALGLLYYGLYYTEHMHYHIVKAYAHLGYKDAQATVGHKLLNGKGVEVNHTAAMEWFKMAADQGHPEASYNIAVGHLQGHPTGLEPGDAHKLIQHAASHGVPEAVEVLEKICSRGHCDV